MYAHLSDILLEEPTEKNLSFTTKVGKNAPKELGSK